MRHHPHGLVGAAVLATMLLGPAARPAGAAVDLSGIWGITATLPPGTIFFPEGTTIVCGPLAVVQSGTSLTATGSCPFIGALSLAGTVDPDTGAFSLSQSGGLCSSFTVTATSTADSRTFAGALSCSTGVPFNGTVTGSRCGNGIVDPWETCDNNLLAADCCSATCQFEAAGTGCLDEGNFCTDDVCDGGGVCVHPDNTEPCNDSNDCTGPDVCGGGSCAGPPRAAGSDCDDADACTTNDGCDGAGACTPGPPLSCDPPCGTGVCNPQYGCEADVETTCDDPTGIGGKLGATDLTPDTKDKLTWMWSKGPAIALADFGTPTVDTSYTLCMSDLVYEYTGSGYQIVPRFLQAQTAPAGTKWLPTSKGFRYVDKLGTPNGLTGITLSSGPTGRSKIKVKGKGSNLFRDLEPTGTSPFFQPPLVQLKASNGRCWDTPELRYLKVTDGKFKAKGSPSGAFVE